MAREIGRGRREASETGRERRDASEIERGETREGREGN